MKNFIFLFSLLIIAGCTGQVASDEGSAESNTDFRDLPLTDVKTGEDFRLSDFSGPVLLETFAVWCPTCLKQQKEIQPLHTEGINTIAVNIDPNEDKNVIDDYIDEHGFEGIFAKSSREFTDSLVKEFGFGVVSTATAPVILFCDGEGELLEKGVKDYDTLKSRVGGCA